MSATVTKASRRRAMLALRHVAAAFQFQETSMTQDHAPAASQQVHGEVMADEFDEEFQSIGDHHRMAAHHFTAAARHHLAAATADDEGDDEANARHAHQAYRHQLNGTQYAEIAIMDNEALELEDEFGEVESADADLTDAQAAKSE